MGWLLWWRPPCVLRIVIVNLKHDETQAIKGVLWRVRGEWFTLRDAAHLKTGTITPMDGEVIVHRSNISFLQVVAR